MKAWISRLGIAPGHLKQIITARGIIKWVIKVKTGGKYLKSKEKRKKKGREIRSKTDKS